MARELRALTSQLEIEMKNKEKETAAQAAETDTSIEEAGSPMKPLFLFVLLPMILLVAWGIFAD